MALTLQDKPELNAQVAAARRGSEQDLAALLARFMPLIRLHARRAAGPGLDYEDAVQEGVIGLMNAIRYYSAGRGAAFPAYASVCVRNAVASAGKAAGRRKHAPLNYGVPLPEQQSVPGPEEQAIAGEQLRLTLARARRVLSPLEKRALRLTLDGLSYAEIARRIGRDEKAVDNALARVRRKLR